MVISKSRGAAMLDQQLCLISSYAKAAVTQARESATIEGTKQRNILNCAQRHGV